MNLLVVQCLDGPRGEGAVVVRAHELLTLVVPRDGSHWVGRLDPHFRDLAPHVPEDDLPAFVTY